MNATTFDKAREQSVRVFPDADQNPAFVALNLQRDPVLPPWGTRRREWALRNWYRNSYNWMTQGTIMGLITKFLSSPWEVSGPKAGVNYAPYFQDVLREMPPGSGWDEEWSKLWLDYFRQDGGGYLEVVGPGKADGELTGRMTGLAHLDSLRCYPTADPEFPVIYWDRDGQRHKMHTSRILHFVDMPDGDDFNPGYGLCALSRAIAIVEQQYYMLRYARENLDELPPPGFATITGMTQAAFDKAIEAYLERKSRDLPPAYGNVVTLFGADAAITPKLDFQTFSRAPEKYDYVEWVNLQVNALALVFGIDKQEIWELGGGGAGRGMGTAAQSETLHAKSETKTIGHMRALVERRLNSTLPRSCEFQFKIKDGQQAQQDAVNAQTWGAAVTSMGSLIQPNEARQILANMVEAVRDAITDEAGELIRLNDADLEPEEDQITGDDTAPVDTNAPAGQAPAPPVAQKDYADTRAQFVANIIDLFHAGNQDDLNRRRAGVVMRAQLNRLGRQAYEDGLKQGGVEDGMDDEDRATFTVWLATQSQYVTRFLDELYTAGLTDKEIEARADVWANKSLQGAYYDGVSSADRNGLYEFVGTDGLESCDQCKALKGQVHRMKDWTSKGLRPGVDTVNFDCGGWQCQHGLTKTSGKASGNWLGGKAFCSKGLETDGQRRWFFAHINEIGEYGLMGMGSIRNTPAYNARLQRLRDEVVAQHKENYRLLSKTPEGTPEYERLAQQHRDFNDRLTLIDHGIRRWREFYPDRPLPKIGQ